MPSNGAPIISVSPPSPQSSSDASSADVPSPSTRSQRPRQHDSLRRTTDSVTLLRAAAEAIHHQNNEEEEQAAALVMADTEVQPESEEASDRRRSIRFSAR